MKGLERVSLRRLMMRLLTSRCRPVMLLLAFLGVWLLLSVFYFHSPSSAGDARDTPAALAYQMQVRHEHQREEQRLALPLQPQKPEAAEGSQAVNSSNVAARADGGGRPVTDTFEAAEEEFAARRKLYESMCSSGFSGPVAEIYYYEPAKLSVCHVPKVGCTFWKRIFHFLYNDTDGKPITSPFEIDRFYVHFGARKKTKTTNYNSKKSMIDTHNKVLFTRDPWARLWSSYVDKFVLPDSWLDHGRSIVSRRKDKGRRQFCADNIEFVEFLDYALNANRDVHWRPVYKVCSPCSFHPQYLGKMETFSRDTTHILRKVGLEKLVAGHDHAHYAEDEVRMLTLYHFRLYETRPGLRQCLKHSGVAGRLWKAFVLNGYLGRNATFPTDEFSKELDAMKDTRKAGQKAAELLLKYHRTTSSMSAWQMKQYRRTIMAKHYREAPRELLDKLVDTFNGDFAMFGYEARPSDIFVPYPL